MATLAKWLTIAAGMAVLLLGVLLLPIPGPSGTPVMLVGLGILAPKVAWARRLLDRIRVRQPRGGGKG
jgi:hypothetical protein